MVGRGYLDIGSGVLLERLDKFCCIGGMLGVIRGCSMLMTVGLDVHGGVFVGDCLYCLGKGFH